MPERDLLGRPAPHLAARLAAGFPSDLLLVAHDGILTVLRPLEQGFLRQRLHQPARPAALARALRRRAASGGHPSHVRLAPLPQIDGPGRLPSADVLEAFRADAARAVRAAAGLRAPVALLVRGGGLALDRAGGILATPAQGPPVGVGLSSFWRFHRADAAVTALARRLPDGVFDLPEHPSAHDRMVAAAFLDEETLAEIRRGWPSDTALRFVRQGPAIAVLRLLAGRRAVPCLLALAP